MKQLSLDLDSVSGSLSEFDSERNCVSEQPRCSVNEYSPGKKKQTYYRLSWRDGKRIKHLHIRGGNVNSKLAQERADSLRQMIARGAELEEIIAAVETYAQDK